VAEKAKIDSEISTLKASVTMLTSKVADSASGGDKEPTNYVTKQQLDDLTASLPDISKYTTRTEVRSMLNPYVKTVDADETYATKGELPAGVDLTDYVRAADVLAIMTANEVAWKSELPDLSPYALHSEIPVIPAMPDWSTFATKDELPVMPTLPDFSTFATKAELPTAPDLSGYALKSELPVMPTLPDFSTFATKAELPDMSQYAKKNEVPIVPAAPDLSGYALKT